VHILPPWWVHTWEGIRGSCKTGLDSNASRIQSWAGPRRSIFNFRGPETDCGRVDVQVCMAGARGHFDM